MFTTNVRVNIVGGFNCRVQDDLGLWSLSRWWISLLDASATPCSTCFRRVLVQASGLVSVGRLCAALMGHHPGARMLTGGLTQEATAAFLPMVWTGYDMIAIFMSCKICLAPTHTSAAAYCHYHLPKIESGFADCS